MGYGLDLVEGWSCGCGCGCEFVVVICLRICGGRYIVVGGRLLWLVEDVVAGRLFLIICGWYNYTFYFFYVVPNTVKYFPLHFPRCNQTPERNYFL